MLCCRDYLKNENLVNGFGYKSHSINLCENQLNFIYNNNFDMTFENAYVH